jgi:hypothetical protein
VNRDRRGPGERSETSGRTGGQRQWNQVTFHAEKLVPGAAGSMNRRLNIPHRFGGTDESKTPRPW